MKLLSIIIPSYNSSAYMKRCIDSCLTGGEAVEILIINDGSTDATGEIADQYAADYPSIIRAIHQSNKGHGGALNTGIREATGKYLKVVDSDDWVDKDSLSTVLQNIKSHIENDQETDLFITNFVHEQEKSLIKKEMHYRDVIPTEILITWEDLGKFKKRQCLLMHSLIYKTSLLVDSQLLLPENTFYVDNLFVFVPLQYVQKMFYLNVPLYRYYIGREDQSVNEKVMIRRKSQQVRVNKLLIDEYKMATPHTPKLNDYLIHHVEAVTIISSALLNRIGTEESMTMKEDLWNYLQVNAEEVYERVKGSFYERVVNFKGKSGQLVFNVIYKTVRMVAGYS